MKMLEFNPQLIILGQLILPVMLFLIGEERKKYFWLRAAGSLLFSVLLLLLYIKLPAVFGQNSKDILSYFLTYFLVVLFVLSAYHISAVGAIFLSSCSIFPSAWRICCLRS